MDRTKPPGMLGTDSWQNQAKYFIDYYDSLRKNPDEQLPLLLGAYMARQWLRYLEEPKTSKEELILFVQALEEERPNQGSAWGDMWSRVRIYIFEVEGIAWEDLAA